MSLAITLAVITGAIVFLRRRDLFPGLYYPPTLTDSAVKLARKEGPYV